MVTSMIDNAPSQGTMRTPVAAFLSALTLVVMKHSALLLSNEYALHDVSNKHAAWHCAAVTPINVPASFESYFLPLWTLQLPAHSKGVMLDQAPDVA